MDEYTKRIRIHKAYNDKAFQKKLKEHRDVIEGKLQAFLDWLQEDSTSSPKILGGLEMRVKSFDSFYEKLDRKDYIHEWDDISENLENNQKVICQKLPDLIGFRLNCYFFQDERNIYNRLKRYYEGGNFSKIELDFSEGTTQANGHDIYKVGGKYFTDNDLYVRFELQIKSLFHNMWGEVDHKTIYKSKQYDLFKESRKEITEQIFKVLHASDKQLTTLYTQKYTQTQLLEALFYEMTNAEIVSTTNTSLLGIHYSNFYSIFYRDNFLNKAYREYIVKRLLEEKYLKKECPSINVNDDIRYFVDYINENYLAYHINMLYHIASILLKFKDNDHFKIYMISRIIDKHKDTAISDASQSSLVVDAFDDTVYGDESRDSWKNDVIVSMDSWFKKRDKNGNKH